MNPKVSIIIPVYNGSNFLGEAITSALGQSYQNLEVIVVNDGSCDDGKTEAIAKSFGNRIRYFSKENGGVSSALNVGIEKMSGEYFSWLSHDDIYYCEKIERQVDFLNDNSGLKAVFCNSEIVNAEGITKYVQRKVGPQVVVGPFHALQTWIFACSLLVHRSCFAKTGVFNEANRTTQDIEFVMNLLHFFQVGHLSQVLVKRRDHEECGYRQLRDLNRFELDALLQNVLETQGITFFFHTLESKHQKAKAYEILGDLTAHAGIPFSKRCYQLSSRAWPSLANPARYKKLFGKRLAYFFSRLSIIARAFFRQVFTTSDDAIL